MKLLFCGHCTDVVRLFQEERSCKCGKSSGRYLEDGSTTVQSSYTLSIGLHNHDFNAAIKSYNQDPDNFSPLIWIRAWINPISEADVQFVDDTDAESQPAD